MTSFASLAVNHRLGNHSNLFKLSSLIDWSKFDRYLFGLNKNDLHPGNGGNKSYHKTAMFKLILLGQWNSLSDADLEYALRVRLDFISFCGFDINDDIPDETTICRFRNKLITKNLLAAMLDEVNKQLVKLGLTVAKTNLAILDATIIESSCRPKGNVLEEDLTVDRFEDQADKFKELPPSADPDAKWLKKGRKFYFGYKAFATVDEEGFIKKTKTIPANQAETNNLADMLIAAKQLAADKAYDSKTNRAILQKNNIKTRIMYKKSKNKPTTIWQKRFNQAVSKKRFRVEQTFGTLKRRFGFNRASYQTTIKVNAQFTLKAICLNLLKAINKVSLITSPELKTG